MTRGMATEARAIIDYEQPYNVGTERRTFDRNQWKSYLPSVLCKMLDKHRSLAVSVAGISKPNVQVSWCSEGFGILRPTYVAPGDELSSYKELSNRIPYDQVDFEVRGVPHVAVNVSQRDSSLPDDAVCHPRQDSDVVP